MKENRQNRPLFEGPLCVISLTCQLFIKGTQSKCHALQQIERMPHVHIEKVLSELAEKYLRLSVLAVFLTHHDEVLDTRDCGPTVKVKHIGFNARIPFRGLILELSHSGGQLLLFLMLVKLIETFLIDYWLVARNECAHFSGSFQSEDVGLVLNSDDLIALIRIDRKIRKFLIGIVPQKAVELSSEEVGEQLGNYCFPLGGGGRVGELFVFGDKKVSVFGFDDGQDVAERDGVIDLVAGDGVVAFALNDALQDAHFGDGLEVVLFFAEGEHGCQNVLCRLAWREVLD